MMCRIRWAIWIAFVAALALLPRSSVRGQSPAQTAHLFIPVIQTADTASLGIAFSNPTLDSATVTLTALSYSGQQVTGPGITNPATISIPPQGQSALQATEIFGSGISGKTGWIDIVPSTPAIKGFFLLFDGPLSYIDGSSLIGTPSGRIVFPKVSAGTSISFVNTSSQAVAHASFSLYDGDGHLVSTRVIGIGAYSGFSGSASDLIPDIGSFTGYAILDTAGTLFSQSVDVLAGFESYANRADIAVLTAVPADNLLRDGYVAHFVSQGGYYTEVGLVNPTSQPQRVLITTDAQGSNGPVERTIPANGRLAERADQMFGLSGNATITGYLHYQVEDNGSGLMGYVEYGTTDGLLLSAVAAQGTSLSDIFFSQIAQGNGFYTGLALLNPNTQPVSITIDAFDKNGQPIGSTSTSLAAGGRLARLSSEYFPALTSVFGGYFHVASSRPVFAYELFGSSGSATILANVPAQGTALLPQENGRPVVAAQGANVISNDGSTTLAIPPGALTSDTAVSVTSISIADLPSPSAGQHLIAAVDAEPARTTFTIPAKLTFPLAAQLPPDSSLPVLLFDPLSKQYGDSGFTAHVDQTGRTASAEITHFSTYAAALPDSQTLNVTGLSPSSGSVGTLVTLSGTGFSPNASENNVTFSGGDNTAVSAPVTNETATSLTVSVPQGAATGYVIVRAGTRTSIGLMFTVPQLLPKPSISAVSPSTMTLGAASAEIQISGTGFRPVSTTTYDGTTMTCTYVDSTLLLMTLAGNQLKPGSHQIAVANPSPGGGSSNSVEFIVKYPKPTIASAAPNPVDQDDATTVTFTGSGFTTDSLIVVDGATITPTFVNATTLRVPSRSLAPGNHFVAVSNPQPGGGVTTGIPFLVRAAVNVAGILLVDPYSGAATSEIDVNEGNSIQPGVVIVDSTGSVNPSFQPTFASLDTSVATVDSGGTIQGKKAGFSTLIVSAGSYAGTFTITVAGVDSGVSGYTSNGIAQDLGRKLYLSDTQDDTILQVSDLTQPPTYYAGVSKTPGLKDDLRLLSWFRQPGFLALNQAAGLLYVADSSNNVIRQVSPGDNGRVTTLAGTGATGSLDGPLNAATFSNPQGVADDGRGHLWVADSGNNTIRRINLVAGTVQTIAGQAGAAGLTDGNGAAARFSSPAGLAVVTETQAQLQLRQRAGGAPPPVQVIVADSGNGAIRRVWENGDVETIPTVTSSLVVDVAARTNGRPRFQGRPRVATNPAFSAPTGVAIDPLGNIYVTEVNRGAVKSILNNGTIVPAAQSNTFTNPQGIAVTQTGRIVVAAGNRTAQQIRYGAPQITSVTPSQISNRGGEFVTLTGSNFAPETAVFIGGVPASGVNVQNTQTITFITPAAPSGLSTITVQNRGGIAQRSLLVNPAPASALSAGYITTVAGGSTFSGDGAQATAASLAPPWGAAVTTNGNLLIAETALHRIRQVNFSSTIITTVAGTGQAGFAGDGSIALAAALNNPVGVASDAAGNLYISDTSNQRVRKVDASTGLISTIAGNGLKGFAGDNGPGPNASLFDPFGIAVDFAGNVFVADASNCRIREIAAGTGVITTVAGNGQCRYSGDNGLATAAALNFPYDVAVDSAGNLYIADTYNFRIRKVDALTKIITTIGGNGTLGSSGDGGLATAASINYAYGVNVDSSGNVFVADTFNERIRRIDGTTRFISTVAGSGQRGFCGDSGPATSACLTDPAAVSVDAAGNLYVVDTFNFRVREVASATGIITTVAGNGSQLLSGDNGPAIAAALTLPSAIAVDASDNLFIADTYSQEIREVTSATGTISVVAGNGQKGFSGDNGSATAASMAYPEGVAVDSSGNIFIADTDNNRIREVMASSKTIITIDSSEQAPSGITVDSSGNIYVADTGNNRILKIAAGGGVSIITGPAQVNQPSSVAVDSSGNVYIADRVNNRILKVAPGTGVITPIAGTGARGFSGDGGPGTAATLAEPYGIALDRSGDLLIADSYNNRIRRLNLLTLIITTIAGGGSALGDNGPAGSAQLNNPRGVAVDSAGNILIADWFNGRIRLVRAPVN
jgi:sugar lactone lactonase YvrE